MPGDQVGLVGNTGHSFGSHLHLEIHPTGGDNPIDPYPWLKQGHPRRLTDPPHRAAPLARPPAPALPRPDVSARATRHPRRRSRGSELLERGEAQHEALDPELPAEVDLGLRLVALAEGAHDGARGRSCRG